MALAENCMEEPQVPNYGKRGTGAKLKKEMVIAIEPMINMGTKMYTTIKMDGLYAQKMENLLPIMSIM